jgi:uncharacterized protein (TIGR00297 family)
MAVDLSYVIAIGLAVTMAVVFRLLTVGGGVAALVVGSSVYAGFGIKGLIVLGSFFLTSSLLSNLKKEKKSISKDKNEKGERRDFYQVAANGLVPAMTSLFYVVDSDFVWLLAFIVSIASANSDTWASEAGPLSKGMPLHIIQLKKVEAGTSGAVSFLGTVAAFVGALFIAVLGKFLWTDVSYATMLAIALFGFLGNVIDTVLGATVQVTYRCQRCSFLTEKRVHCNEDTVINSGWRSMNNETVNFLSIFIATSVAFFMLSG